MEEELALEFTDKFIEVRLLYLPISFDSSFLGWLERDILLDILKEYEDLECGSKLSLFYAPSQTTDLNMYKSTLLITTWVSVCWLICSMIAMNLSSMVSGSTQNRIAQKIC